MNTKTYHEIAMDLLNLKIAMINAAIECIEQGYSYNADAAEEAYEEAATAFTHAYNTWNVHAEYHALYKRCNDPAIVWEKAERRAQIEADIRESYGM